MALQLVAAWRSFNVDRRHRPLISMSSFCYKDPPQRCSSQLSNSGNLLEHLQRTASNDPPNCRHLHTVCIALPDDHRLDCPSVGPVAFISSIGGAVPKIDVLSLSNGIMNDQRAHVVETCSRTISFLARCSSLQRLSRSL